MTTTFDTSARPICWLALIAGATMTALLVMAPRGHADTPSNLPVTDDIRSQLLQAGAAQKGLPASDFVGLVPGATFYAFDSDTATYWAGAHLQPSPTSIDGQVSVQDAGSYTLFEQPQGGSWTAFNDGVARAPGCPAPLPAAIITLWGWDPQQCRPVPDI